jgi:mono/diheme cytochrome c family protein
MRQAFASRSRAFLLAALAVSLTHSLVLAAQSSEQGRLIVHASCETCHSLAPGQVKIGPSLYALLNGPAPRSTPEAVKRIIRHGRNNKMPAYGDVFTAVELDSIVQYLTQLP